MFIDFIRYLKGYLKIKIKGYSPERFLNLCKNKGISVWDLEPSHDSYLMYIRVSDFKKIKTIIKKTKTKITIEERIGMPFFFYNYRKRIGFWVGCLCCIAFIFGFTFFIWDIECVGNQTVTEEVLTDFLKEKGIYPGALKVNISCENLAKEIRNDFQEIIWVSVSMHGTKLKFQIKETSDSFKKADTYFDACDLIAKKDGIVKNIITRTGIPKVEKGNEIKKGDLVISGVVEVYNDAKEVIDTHNVIADADIVLQTTEKYSEMLPKKYKRKSYTGKSRKISFLKIGNRIITLNFSNKSYQNQELHYEEVHLKLGEKIFLPIILGKITAKEYQWKYETYSDTELENLLTENFEMFCEELKESHIQIVEKDFTITKTKTGSTLNANLILLEEDCLQPKSIDF